MTESHRYSVSVAAAVVREDGRVLAVKRRDNGHWEPPGGVVDPGEAFQSALVREVLEETGYVIDTGVLTGVYQNMDRNICALVFRCSVLGGEARTSHETARVEWLLPEELWGLVDEAYAVRFEDALSVADGPRVRAHDGVNLIEP
jgi:8-oxo-dGTP diphosphatase